jgi:hypothetical protein
VPKRRKRSESMEVVGNLWPVVDASSGVVQRFFSRAYAMEAPDEVIGQTLTALAPTDFHTAKVYAVPARYVMMTDVSKLPGSVSLSDFHNLQSGIIEEAMRDLEDSGPGFLGIRSADTTLRTIGECPSFSDHPYLVVTTLVETSDGRLLPQL